MSVSTLERWLPCHTNAAPSASTPAQAVNLLDTPWKCCEGPVNAETRAQQKAKDAQEGQDAKALEAFANEHKAGRTTWHPFWRAGELNVRSVVMGDPDSRRLAEQPPAWARCMGNPAQ